MEKEWILREINALKTLNQGESFCICYPKDNEIGITEDTFKKLNIEAKKIGFTNNDTVNAIRDEFVSLFYKINNC